MANSKKQIPNSNPRCIGAYIVNPTSKIKNQKDEQELAPLGSIY